MPSTPRSPAVPWRAAPPPAARSRPSFSRWSCCRERRRGTYRWCSLDFFSRALTVRRKTFDLTASRLLALQLRKPRRCLLNVGRKIRHFLHLADFDDLVRRGRALLRPIDRLLARFHLDHPVTTEDFLGFGKGPVGHDRLAAVERDARAR